MKKCPKCGTIVDSSLNACPKCGTKLSSANTIYAFQLQETVESNGMAVAGFVLSFFVPILGLIFSAVGIGKANSLKSGKGGGLSVAGLVISIISIVISIPILIALLASRR